VSAALSLFVQVLPLAIGAAISPTFLAMQVVVLTSGAPGALARGWALAAGSMSMLLLISFGGLSLLSQLPDFQTGQPSLIQAVILAVGGVALLVAAWVIRRRPVTHKDSMLTRVVDADPPVLFLIGAARLAVNATTLALYIPALHVITNSTVSLVVKALAFLTLFVITEVAVLGPVLAVTVMGERATPLLTRVHEAIERRSRVLTLATCLAFGGLLLVLAVRIAIEVA
jgi:hypothetical protein